MKTNRVRISRWKMAFVTLALALVLAVPVLADETMTLMVSGEGRSASITEASLQPVNYSHEDQPSPGTISLTVDDLSASDEGWNVTVSAGDFTDGERTIPAGNLTVTSASAPTHTAGQGIDETGGPAVPDSGAIGALDTPRKVVHAYEGFGSGTYHQDLDVQLLVPGQTPEGAYVTNLTINITAGP